MTPEAAVEAAALVLDFHLPDNVHENGCALRCGYTGDGLAEHLATHVLEAAAPHMLAEAWANGRAVGLDDAQFHETTPNPYRPAA